MAANQPVVPQASGEERLWLFLDYDGTLAPFAPHPGVIEPDPELIELVRRLADDPEHRRVVVLTGRRLSDIRALLPVPGVMVAASYGIELIDWNGQEVRLVEQDGEQSLRERHLLDQVKKQWAGLIEGQDGFYLEDKGLALALHAKDAQGAGVRKVLLDAAEAAAPLVETGSYRVQGGYRFLEVAPILAEKGRSVTWLLERFAWPGARIIYIGDDDKDETAFRVVNQLGGRTIMVAAEDRPTAAQERLEDYRAVRSWLEDLLKRI